MFSTLGTRPGKPGPDHWTKVLCRQFDENGNELPTPAIVTMYGGSDGGSSEAKRLMRLLNKAYHDFHEGKAVNNQGEVV